MIEKSISYEEIENGKKKIKKKKVEAFPSPDENLLLEFNRYQKLGGELNLEDWLHFYHSDWYDKDKLAKEDFQFGEDTLGYQEYQNYLSGLKSGEKVLSFRAYMDIADISPFDFEGAKGGRVSKKSGLASLAENAVASDLLKSVRSGIVELQFSPPWVQRKLKQR